MTDEKELTYTEKNRLAKNFARASSERTLACYFGYELSRYDEKGRNALLDAYEETIIDQGFKALKEINDEDYQFNQEKKKLKKIYVQFSQAAKGKSKAVKSAVILCKTEIPKGLDIKVEKLIALKGAENVHPFLRAYNEASDNRTGTEFEKKVRYTEALRKTGADIANSFVYNHTFGN